MTVSPEEHARVIAELGEAKTRIEQLETQLATLAAAMEKLQEKVTKNSSNSNLPPSSDGPGAASRGERKPKKPKSERKRGGQKGHRGSHRQLLPPEQVDEVIHIYPEACEACARPLPEVADPDAKRYQQVELLVGGGRRVTQWCRHGIECTCGHITRAAYDPKKVPASAFGPHLTSVVATLTGVYHLSRRNTKMLFHEVFGIDMSIGAISQMEARVSKSLKRPSDEAHADVLAALVKHTDATTWLMAGVTMSLWTLCTLSTTVFRIFVDGARATIESMFADKDGKQHGIMVSDRASVFGFWLMAMRQVCWAHLLRLFVGFSQRAGPTGRFGRELLDHAKLVFEYWQGFTSGKLSREELQCWMEPVQRRFEALLRRIVAANIRGLSGSCANLLAHAEALWTFVRVPGVEPTNNLAERDLRSFVIWRRLCYGCQSERGLRFVERVMTVAMTLRKRGKGVLEYITRCVRADLAGRQTPALPAA
ncbi:MAG TPA: IS66 family transposase [Planctomycetaceae bacterium]|nr:IS66 family transposase [Planctomycetaceae bacterium]